MKRNIPICTILAILAHLADSSCGCWADDERMTVTVEKIVFSPESSIRAMVEEQIDHARHSIDVMVFLFEWKPLADALVRAHERGVRIRVVTDKRSSVWMADSHGKKLNMSAIEYLIRQGIETRIYKSTSNAPSIMHHKAILIDDDATLIGSFNFQFQAETSNHENFFVVHGQEFQQVFRHEFDRLFAACQVPSFQQSSSPIGFRVPLTRNQLFGGIVLLCSFALNLFLIRKLVLYRQRQYMP
jgi:phosphatidylserine/phosphatidylglycerophosphate/cardiolipin synthase-like enzyme